MTSKLTGLDGGGRQMRFAILGAVILAIPAPAWADAKAGGAVFKRECAQCHSTRRGEILTGPSLAGVVGRAAGSSPNFVYSAALKKSGLSWTPQTLEVFIAQPRKMVRGILMTSPGVADPVQRADLIVYLKSLK